MTATPGFAWSGAHQPVTTWRSLGVAGAVIALPVLCLVPLGPPAVRVTVVDVLLLAAVVAAALPATTAPTWRIDAGGVTSRDGVGPSRSVAVDRYDTPAFGQTRGGADELGLLDATVDPPLVVHEVRLTRVGTAFTLRLVARHLGLALKPPPAAPARLEAAERAIRDALATRTTARPEAPDTTFRDPPPRGVLRPVLVRLVTTVVGSRSSRSCSPRVPVARSGSPRRWGTWLVLAALPGLPRVRSARPSVSWPIGAGRVDVVDTRDGRWRLAVDDIGAGVVVTADVPGHGTSPRSAVLVVDRAGRPVAELPLRHLRPSEVTAALNRHGVPTVVAGLAPWDLRGAPF